LVTNTHIKAISAATRSSYCCKYRMVCNWGAGQWYKYRSNNWKI